MTVQALQVLPIALSLLEKLAKSLMSQTDYKIYYLLKGEVTEQGIFSQSEKMLRL